MMTSRRKVKRLIPILFCIVGLTPFMVYSESGHHHETEAHTHGIATLNWVLAGSTLQIALQAPMMDAIGFEHAPVTNDESQLFSAMLSDLKNTNKVVDFIGGGCQLVTATIINPFDKLGPDQGANPSPTHKLNHNDIAAEYQFLCQQPSQFEAININLFDTFPGINVINAQWIVDGKQGGARLDHDQHLVKVR